MVRALRDWLHQLRTDGTPDFSDLVDDHGAGTVWADLTIHDGPGTPALRTVASSEGISVAAIEASLTARIARLLGEARTHDSVKDQIGAILAAPESYNVKHYCIINFGADGLQELARRYKNNEVLPASSDVHTNGREGMVRLFAGVALGTQSPLINEITPRDAVLVNLEDWSVQLARLFGQGQKNRSALREYIVLDEQYHEEPEPPNCFRRGK